jgi:hypothetical protein
MTEAEALLAVRSLIADADRWFKDGIARADDHRKVSLTHPHASRFSLDGAFYRVHHITRDQAVTSAYDFMLRAIDSKKTVRMANFNNAQGTTHWAVMQMLDRAIRLAGGTPPIMQDEEQ